MSAKKLYIIGNSHMDPIWLWRLKEGRSTWLNTCRSVVRILQKYPMLRFVRSSVACYRWLEECDPELFQAIASLIDAGRWEAVGGWEEQSDTVITPAAALLRQSRFGREYFRRKFGREISIAYCVDSFGQNCGLPKLLAESGFRRYVWMRPDRTEKEMPHQFRWLGDDGTAEVTAFRVLGEYTTVNCRNREQLFARIEYLLENGDEHQSFFFGIGDHGGGIYEEQLRWLLLAAERYPLEFSTLEHYFEVIEAEKLPVVSGELLHHAPGCYSSVEPVKNWMAEVEKKIFKAEKLLLESDSPDRRLWSRELEQQSERLMLNYFHDVYSGTCIKTVYDWEIRNLVGAAAWCADSIIDRELCRLGTRCRSDFLTEGGILLWNPLPVPQQAIIRYDTNPDPNHTGRDFNVLIDEQGGISPLQFGNSESNAAGKGRLAIVSCLPASGIRVLAFGRSSSEFPPIGFHRQYQALESIDFAVLADTGDTWGHGLIVLGKTVGHLERYSVKEWCDGPVFSTLRVLYRTGDSTVRMDLTAYAGVEELEIGLKLDWREAKSVLKLCRRPVRQADVTLSGQTGTTVRRAIDHREQPFIDWVGMEDETGVHGFFSSSLHGYDVGETGELRLTVCRPVVYAEHTPHPPHGDEGMADYGELQRKLWWFDLPSERVAPVCQSRLLGADHIELTAVSDGTGFHRPAWSLEPDVVIPLGQRRRDDGVIEWELWNSSDKRVPFQLRYGSSVVASGEMEGNHLRLLKLQI